MTEVRYAVDFHDGAWCVRLNDKRFGPYSSLDAAVLAATGAARKAEAMGYEALIEIDASEPPPAAAAGRDEADRNAA